MQSSMQNAENLFVNRNSAKLSETQMTNPMFAAFDMDNIQKPENNTNINENLSASDDDDTIKSEILNPTYSVKLISRTAKENIYFCGPSKENNTPS